MTRPLYRGDVSLQSSRSGPWDCARLDSSSGPARAGDAYAKKVSVARLTLLGKPGCHLCDDAREVVSAVLAEHPDVEFDERNILDDQALFDRYWEEIPVVLLDGTVHTVWKVDDARLRAALAAD